MFLGRIDEHDRIGQAEALFLISWQYAPHGILSLSCDDSNNKDIRRDRGDHNGEGEAILILAGKLPTFLPVRLHIKAGDAAPVDHTLRVQLRATAFKGALNGVAAPDNGSALGQQNAEGGALLTPKHDAP
jgi:hypothetical protein